MKIAATIKLAVVLLVTFLSNAAFAGTTSDNAIATNYSVKYVGTQQKGIVFNMQYQNTEASKFIVQLSDEAGSVLYRQVYNGSNFNSNIVLDKDAEYGNLTFSITAGKKVYSEKFSVEAKTKVIDEVVVVKKN